MKRLFQRFRRHVSRRLVFTRPTHITIRVGERKLLDLHLPASGDRPVKVSIHEETPKP